MKIKNILKSFGLFQLIELLLWLPVVLFIMALLTSRFVGESPMLAQLRKGVVVKWRQFYQIWHDISASETA